MINEYIENITYIDIAGNRRICFIEGTDDALLSKIMATAPLEETNFTNVYSIKNNRRWNTTLFYQKKEPVGLDLAY